MKFWLILRLLLFPLLLPLSLLFGVLAFIRRKTSHAKVKPEQKVISVGNIQVGGTGKTPVVSALCEKLGERAVVIVRNYGAPKRKNEPQEVFTESDPFVCGDEALEIKKKFPETRVFSGPSKSMTVETIAPLVPPTSVFIVDDGAQHLNLHRDLDIIVWDFSRPLLDFFPFPLGFAREFWFTSFSKKIDIINRISSVDQRPALKKILSIENAILSDYSLREIKNFSSSHKDFVLISGIGNFQQLLSQVKEFLKNNNSHLSDFIKAKDHDDFKWFKSSEKINYIMTEKDFVKLESKIPREQVFVVQSDYSEDFKSGLMSRVESNLDEKFIK